MADTSWPCPRCGQTQKAEHPPGASPFQFRDALCAQCLEDSHAADKDLEKEKRKQRQ
jgi:hypothetical protein